MVKIYVDARNGDMTIRFNFREHRKGDGIWKQAE